MHIRIDREPVLIYRSRESAEELAAMLTADDECGDVEYVVIEVERGCYVAANDVETGERIGTL